MDSLKKQEGYLGVGNRRILGKDPSPGGNDYGLALENGDGLLQEDDFYILLENN